MDVDDRAPVVQPRRERRQRFPRGAGERISELAIEIRRSSDERVIDGVLGELQARDIVAEERLDVAALEEPAQVRARPIEDA